VLHDLFDVDFRCSGRVVNFSQIEMVETEYLGKGIHAEPATDAFILLNNRLPDHLYLSGWFKVALVGAAQGADPVFGNVLESGSRSNAAVRIADFRIVDVIAYHTTIFGHDFLPWISISRSPENGLITDWSHLRKA
jgi:hypothetical protein